MGGVGGWFRYGTLLWSILKNMDSPATAADNDWTGCDL